MKVTNGGGHHTLLEYNKIPPQIYLGTNSCCEMHFNKKLLKKGVTLDVSMEGEKIDRPIGIKYYLWLPTRDHTAPDMKKLAMGVHVIREAVDAGEKVYVHCKNGHGRAPTMLAAYLISSKNLTATDAVAFIKKRRPEIHLDPSQLKRLAQWERKHRV